jgi:hypothetical protein
MSFSLSPSPVLRGTKKLSKPEYPARAFFNFFSPFPMEGCFSGKTGENRRFQAWGGVEK